MPANGLSGLRRFIPWGLVGMIGLVLPAERFVSRQGFYVLDLCDWGYLRKGHVAAREARRYQVLVFGDSLSAFGVVPRAVAAGSGRSTYNLAIAGSQAPASCALLRRVLASGGRPDAVVINFYPPLLATGPRQNLTRWASILGVVESAALSWRAQDPGLFGVVTAGRLLPSFRARAGLRDHVIAALEGREDWRPALNHVRLRNWTRNDGAQLNPSGMTPGFETDAQLVRFYDGQFSRLHCDPANAEGVREFLSLAAEHGVTVYWLLPPILPRFQTLLTERGFDAEHEAFLRSWQARFANLVVLDGRNAVPDPGVYTDPCHLSAPGAYAFSLTLGDSLRRPLPPRGPAEASARTPSTRWVTLPATAIGPVPPEVEDHTQTRLALIAEQAARSAGADRHSVR